MKKVDEAPCSLFLLHSYVSLYRRSYSLSHTLSNTYSLCSLLYPPPFLAHTRTPTAANYCQLLSTTANYCQLLPTKVEKTAEWGGQLELRALCHVLQTPIVVYSSTQKPVTMDGAGFTQGKALKLTYHEHYYTLGEHYNSVEPA